MNIGRRSHSLPIWPLATILALGLVLAACGEQTGGEQQGSAPTTEEQSGTTTQ